MPKKSTTKKTTKTSVKKPVAAPVMDAHTCSCGADCKCGCHGGKFRKFIVLLIVFGLGFAIAKITCCSHGRHMPRHNMREMHPVFVNGCLDMESVKSPKMKELLQTADTDADNCISIAEYKTVKSAMRGPKNK